MLGNCDGKMGIETADGVAVGTVVEILLALVGGLA